MSTSIESGWYDDPDITGTERYWDGKKWTAQTRGKALRYGFGISIRTDDDAFSGLDGFKSFSKLFIFAFMLGVLSEVRWINESYQFYLGLSAFIIFILANYPLVSAARTKGIYVLSYYWYFIPVALSFSLAYFIPFILSDNNSIFFDLFGTFILSIPIYIFFASQLIQIEIGTLPSKTKVLVSNKGKIVLVWAIVAVLSMIDIIAYTITHALNSFHIENKRIIEGVEVEISWVDWFKPYAVITFIIVWAIGLFLGWISHWPYQKKAKKDLVKLFRITFLFIVKLIVVIFMVTLISYILA